MNHRHGQQRAREATERLQMLSARAQCLLAVGQVLETRAKGKPFFVANRAVWQLMVDNREAWVRDFDAWMATALSTHGDSTPPQAPEVPPAARALSGEAPATATLNSLGLDVIGRRLNYGRTVVERRTPDEPPRASTPPQLQAEARQAASALVDLLLFGARDRLELLTGLTDDLHRSTHRYPHQYRQAFYDRLHAQRRDPDKPFNHPAQFELDDD